jgi:hypothetical protein
MTQVTKQLYNDAHAAKEILSPAIEAMTKIQYSHIFDAPKVAQRINVVTCELQLFLNSWEDIIQRGDQAYANRPEALIQASCNRLLDEIPKQINLEQKNLEHHLKGRQIKLEELKKKGFAPAEIDHICPAGPEVDVDASKARVAALEAEAMAIEAFLADGPRFDVGLLQNTALALLTESEAA